MKIVKRDGRIVEYDSDKIRIAINKANKEVTEECMVSSKEIESIIKYIEKLRKKRMLVEDIQDIIEEKLMGLGKYELAKRYIIYRYTRALVRKANTTDETILSLIKNSDRQTVEQRTNRNMKMAATQRDLIAGEISKDIAKRILIPEKISIAHNERSIYFHDLDYFLQPIINRCLINIGDMLDNGTVMNEKIIETPKSFQVACTVMTQIIALVASGQYGGQSIEIKYLGKYLRASYEKYKSSLEAKYMSVLSGEQIEEMAQDRVKEELTAGVQTIQYQINTLMTTSGKPPFVTLFLNLDDEDEYIQENARIIEEILKQRIEGIKDKSGNHVSLEFPKLVYVLSNNNLNKDSQYYNITKLAIESSLKQGYPHYISAKKMRENNKNNVFSPIGTREILPLWKDEKNKYSFIGRFSQGTVSLNLPQIALEVNGNIEKFWLLLEERLALCFEALMCRHYSLLGTSSDISPVHWQYGAIARLEPGEKIDRYLKEGFSTLCLGYVGLYEVTKIMTGESHMQEEGKKFAIELMKKLKNTCEKWTQDTHLAFSLYATSDRIIAKEFVAHDREMYGNQKDITDKETYTDSYHITDSHITMKEKLEIESEFENMSTGGGISIIQITNEDVEKVNEILEKAYNSVQYFEIKKCEN